MILRNGVVVTENTIFSDLEIEGQFKIVIDWYNKKTGYFLSFLKIRIYMISFINNLSGQTRGSGTIYLRIGLGD